MEGNDDMDKAFGMSRWFLEKIGIWPDPSVDWTNASARLKYKFLLPTSVLVSFVLIPQTIDLIMYWGNLEFTFENLSLVNIVVVMCTSLMFMFRYSIEDMKAILLLVAKDWLTLKSEEEREEMFTKIRLGRFLVMLGYITTEATIFGYFILKAYISLTSGVENRQLFYRGYFPYDFRPTPRYHITVLLQLLGGQIGCFTLTGINSFVTFAIFHACGQFINLRRDTQNLVPAEYKSGDQVEFGAKVATIVQKHTRLIRFATAVERNFNKLILIQILVCTAQLGLQGYMVNMELNGPPTKSHKVAATVMSMYFLFILAHVFALCFQGEMLIKESAAFAYAIYECDWTILQWRHTKPLLIIMTRAKIPLFLTGGKIFTLSMEFFAQILKTSLTYCSVLLTLVND